MISVLHGLVKDGRQRVLIVRNGKGPEVVEDVSWGLGGDGSRALARLLVDELRHRGWLVTGVEEAELEAVFEARAAEARWWIRLEPPPAGMVGARPVLARPEGA